MRSSRFSDEQIIGMIKEQESRVRLPQARWQHCLVDKKSTIGGKENVARMFCVAVKIIALRDFSLSKLQPKGISN